MATHAQTFTEAQGHLIVALAKVHAEDLSESQRLLQFWTPARFTPAQTECIQGMLALEADDLRETLVDALEPCALRVQLRAMTRR